MSDVVPPTRPRFASDFGPSVRTDFVPRVWQEALVQSRPDRPPPHAHGRAALPLRRVPLGLRVRRGPDPSQAVTHQGTALSVPSLSAEDVQEGQLGDAHQPQTPGRSPAIVCRGRGASLRIAAIPCASMSGLYEQISRT